MPTGQVGRITRALLLLQLCALPLASGLSAQLGGTAQAYAGTYPHGRGLSIQDCFYSLEGPSLNPVLAGGTCYAQYGGPVAAYARYGMIGAYMSYPELGLASATWSDIVSWSNPLVSSIVFDFAVNGQVIDGENASIRYGFSYGSPAHWTTGRYYFASDPPAPFDAILWHINAPVAGRTSLPFEYSLSMFNWFTTADFWQGTGLTGLTFLDAQGNAINGVDYDFAAGTEFLDTEQTPPLSFTPEPGTITLLGTGLLGLLGAWRRRGRGKGREHAA